MFFGLGISTSTQRQPQCRLTPPPLGTPANIRIFVIFLKKQNHRPILIVWVYVHYFPFTQLSLKVEPSESTKNCRCGQPRLTPPVLGTLANICAYLIFGKLNPGLTLCRLSYWSIFIRFCGVFCKPMRIETVCSRSSKVTDFGTNRKRDFLLVRHSNLGPTLRRFRDIAGFLLRNGFSTLFHPNFGVFPLNQMADVGSIRVVTLSYSAVKLFSKYSNLCDRRT